MSTRAIVATATLLLAALLIACGNPTAQTAPPIVSMNDYNRIKEGMSYQEVFEIIGTHGEEDVRSNMGGVQTVMFTWKNADGSNMNAMFQQGRLVTKAQFGLPASRSRDAVRVEPEK